MKAVLTGDPPAGDGWVYERKLDGIRCLAVKDGGRTRLWSRNELSLNDRYAAIAAALDDDPADGFVLDGEAVTFVGGRDRFGGGEGGELFYYVFDVLIADGRDVRALPLEERRAGRAPTSARCSSGTSTAASSATPARSAPASRARRCATSPSG